MLRLVDRFGSGNALVDNGIREISILLGTYGPRLVAYSGTNGGVATYSVDAAGRLSPLSSATVSTGYGLAPEGDMAVAWLGSTMTILLGFTGSPGLAGWGTNAAGAIGGRYWLALPENFGDKMLIAAQPGPTSPLFILSPATGRIAIFDATRGTMVELTGAGSTLVGCTEVIQTDINGQSHLICVDASRTAISVHRLDATSNSLSRVGQITQGEGLAVADLSDLDIVRMGSDTFLIAAGAGSSSLTVMRLSPAGHLTLTDHVLDSRDTRFQSVRAVDTIEVDGHVFVVAGGGDDGVTLFQLLPNGTLHPLATMEDTLATGLSNVTAVEILRIGTQLMIFVGGESESGLTVLEWSLGTLGEVIDGTGGGTSITGTAGSDIMTSGANGQSLSGGSGNDILIANTSETRLTGGGGADVFVLTEAAMQTTITDFQRGLDRVDPTGWPMLRDVSQLTITQRSDGITLGFFGRNVVIQSADGLPLSLGDVLPNGLGPARIAPSVLTDRPTGGSAPGTGDGATSPGTPIDPGQQGGGGTIPAPVPVPPPPPPPPPPALNMPSAPVQRSPLPDWSTDPAWANGSTSRMTLIGTGNADTLDGASGRDWLDAGGGDDLIHTGFGADTVLAGAGNDTIFAAGGHNELWAGPGDDVIRARHGDDTIGGGPGNDLIDAGGGRNTIWSLSGNDTAMGGSGPDQIGGGPGNDQLFGFAGDDLIFGGLDHDTIHGGSGHDTIWGGSGNDLITGGTGNDIISAGDGTDHLWGDAGADTFVFYRNNGTNFVRDFNSAEGDQIHLGRWMLSNINATGHEIVQQYGQITPEGAVLDFRDAFTQIIFPGLTDLGVIADTIILF